MGSAEPTRDKNIIGIAPGEVKHPSHRRTISIGVTQQRTKPFMPPVPDTYLSPTPCSSLGGMLPLVLGMVGSLAKDQPLEPASWRTVHEKLRRPHTKFREMDNAKLFYAYRHEPLRIAFDPAGTASADGGHGLWSHGNVGDGGS